MTISPVTVFEGTLPSMTDPVTFDPRMAALMEFIVNVFGPEFAASIGQINSAFAGADDVTTALAALTVSRGYGAAAAPLRGRNDAATIRNDGFAYANAGTAGNPTSDEAYLFLRHKGAGDAVGAILAVGQTSRNFYVAVRNAGAWGDWLQMPRIGTTAGTVPVLDGSGLLSADRIPVLQARSLNGTGTAPVYGARLWCNFNGTIATGTYSQTGNVITVTITAHGLVTGEVVPLDFTTGTSVDGNYAVTVTGPNTFTVVAPDSKTTSGNVSRGVYIRGGANGASVVRTGVGSYILMFVNAMPTAFYAVFGNYRLNDTVTPDNNDGQVSFRSPTTSEVSIQTMNGASAVLDPARVTVVIFG